MIEIVFNEEAKKSIAYDLNKKIVKADRLLTKLA